jgi:hypothetical protein
MTIHWLSVLSTATDIAHGLGIYVLASIPIALGVAACMRAGYGEE